MKDIVEEANKIAGFQQMDLYLINDNKIYNSIIAIYKDDIPIKKISSYTNISVDDINKIIADCKKIIIKLKYKFYVKSDRQFTFFRL